MDTSRNVSLGCAGPCTVRQRTYARGGRYVSPTVTLGRHVMVQGEVGPVTEGVSAFGGEPEPSDSLRTFGAVVQALREHAGLSREEFGARVGLSKHTVASIETGRRMPDPDFVERAEPVLGNTGALTEGDPQARRAGSRGLQLVPPVGADGADGDQPVHVRMPRRPGPACRRRRMRGRCRLSVPPLGDAEIEAQRVAAARTAEAALRGAPNVARSASSWTRPVPGGRRAARTSPANCSATCWR